MLLPDGFRFSPGKTRRDWSDESIAQLRKFYAGHTTNGEGKLVFQPYLLATIRHREALTAGKITPAEVAVLEKINAKYLGVLWQTLTDKTPSHPLDLIRGRWRTANEKDVATLTTEITAWQTALSKFEKIGSYRAAARQIAVDPPATESQPLKLAVKPAPGQNEVVLYLTTHDAAPDGKAGLVVWHRPRFEAAGKPPLLLRDYGGFGPAFGVDYSSVFADTAKYLAATAEAAHDRTLSTENVAKKHGVDAALLKALDRGAGPSSRC